MTLESLLENIIGFVAKTTYKVGKYAVLGEKVEQSLGDRFSIGFKGLLLVLCIILTCTGIGATISIPIGYLIYRSLVHKNKFIGIGPLFLNTALVSISIFISIFILFRIIPN